MEFGEEVISANSDALRSRPQMSVSVPVTLVRRSAQANTRNDNGIRIAAKSSRAAIEGHSSRHPALPSNAARIPSRE